MAEKTKGELLKEKLLFKPVNGAEKLLEEDREKVWGFNEKYKEFLDQAKTEREAVAYTVKLLEENGYVPFEAGKAYQPGEKVYLNNRGKSLIFATIGTESIDKGVSVMASHIDSPRIDLKPHPLYEDSGMAMFKTHYYGGIKKYQWVALPLSLHGVVCKKDGTTVQFVLGEKDSDPVLCISDLLPHLAKDQMSKPMTKAFTGEDLNALVGTLAVQDEKVDEKFKLHAASILFDQYGITEEDLLSAELSLVPNAKARDVGLDRSIVGAYGHDDRVCAYTSIRAALEAETPKYTHVTVLADKEEIGSEGNTGMKSAFLQYFIEDLAEAYGVKGRTVLCRSLCFSADVNAAYDPNYASVYEKQNSSMINGGVVITKYTGSGGKSGTNDASAETMAKVRRILDRDEVLWQTGELGKVDQGGGGTVAMYIANLGVDVVDLGVPVLSMHAPFEMVSKLDVYNTFRAFKAFASRD